MTMQLALAIHYPENTNQNELCDLMRTHMDFFAAMHHAMSLRKLYSREVFYHKLISDGYESFITQFGLFQHILQGK